MKKMFRCTAILLCVTIILFITSICIAQEGSDKKFNVKVARQVITNVLNQQLYLFDGSAYIDPHNRVNIVYNMDDTQYDAVIRQFVYKILKDVGERKFLIKAGITELAFKDKYSNRLEVYSLENK